jgi:hypothetical protein
MRGEGPTYRDLQLSDLERFAQHLTGIDHPVNVSAYPVARMIGKSGAAARD